MFLVCRPACITVRLVPTAVSAARTAGDRQQTGASEIREQSAFIRTRARVDCSTRFIGRLGEGVLRGELEAAVGAARALSAISPADCAAGFWRLQHFRAAKEPQLGKARRGADPARLSWSGIWGMDGTVSLIYKFYQAGPPQSELAAARFPYRPGSLLKNSPSSRGHPICLHRCASALTVAAPKRRTKP